MKTRATAYIHVIVEPVAIIDQLLEEKIDRGETVIKRGEDSYFKTVTHSMGSHSTDGEDPITKAEYEYVQALKKVREYLKATSMPGAANLIFEQDLPDSITPEQYSEWYASSRIVDGVRMGNPLK